MSTCTYTHTSVIHVFWCGTAPSLPEERRDPSQENKGRIKSWLLVCVSRISRSEQVREEVESKGLRWCCWFILSSALALRGLESGSVAGLQPLAHVGLRNKAILVPLPSFSTEKVEQEERREKKTEGRGKEKMGEEEEEEEGEEEEQGKEKAQRSTNKQTSYINSDQIGCCLWTSCRLLLFPFLSTLSTSGS